MFQPFRRPPAPIISPSISLISPITGGTARALWRPITGWVLAGMLVIVASAVRPAKAQPDASSRVEVGQLTCTGKGTVGMILGSKQSLSCRYVPADGGPPQRYTATITKYGLDLGATGATTLMWTVLATTSALPDGALYGSYGGVSADASLGIGGGANVLVGGSNQSIILQPLSVQGQTGVNLAVGVSELTLR